MERVQTYPSFETGKVGKSSDLNLKLVPAGRGYVLVSSQEDIFNSNIFLSHFCFSGYDVMLLSETWSGNVECPEQAVLQFFDYTVYLLHIRAWNGMILWTDCCEK